MKTILIAIATEKYVEAATLKSLWDLRVPPGYTMHWHCATGDQIDQLRNSIADLALDYDYLFSVDSDIIVPVDALERMLAADVDMISGLYVQRRLDSQILEIYKQTSNGGVVNMLVSEIENQGLVEIAACGFGCVLIKSAVIQQLNAPRFFYQSAIDHAHTVSEDVYFCMQLKKQGVRIWADSNIRCDHIGSYVFSLTTPVEQRLQQLYNQPLLPQTHVDYLKKMNINPAVVYDIGACVLHWTNRAREVWPDAQYFLFDALPELRSLYSKLPYAHHIGLLGEQDNATVRFYSDPWNPGGNSRFKETTGFYNETHAVQTQMFTLDTVVAQRDFPRPDLIKLDVQGAELSILQGAQRVLQNCQHVILEAQHVEYNQGAPRASQLIEYMQSIGFEMVANFTRHAVDGDYHFKRKS